MTKWQTDGKRSRTSIPMTNWMLHTAETSWKNLAQQLQTQSEHTEDEQKQLWQTHHVCSGVFSLQLNLLVVLGASSSDVFNNNCIHFRVRHLVVTVKFSGKRFQSALMSVNVLKNIPKNTTVEMCAPPRQSGLDEWLSVDVVQDRHWD